MPQTIKTITAEYAKSYYGFVIDPALPFKVSKESKKQDETEKKESKPKPGFGYYE